MNLNVEGNRKIPFSPREHTDLQAGALGKSAPFTTLDFKTLIISNDLRTKKRVLRYVMQHGTVAMQAFVSKHQPKLCDMIEEAEELESARVDEPATSGCECWLRELVGCCRRVGCHSACLSMA